ncbi:MAG: type II toxin-antitoxin system VapC family toxin, partial [bacterium]
YAPEKGSHWIKGIVEPAAGNVIHLGQIGVVEIAAALSKKVRTRELTQENYEEALQLFLTDVQNEEYITAFLSDPIIELAVDLTKRHPLRGYDAVHLATAISLNTTLLEAELPPLVFVTGDRALREAAQGEGLTVENPDEH